MHDVQATGGTPLSEGSDPAGGRTRLPLLLAVAGAVLLADLVSKFLAVRELGDREPVELLGGVLTLRLVRNPGAAFGMAQGLTVALTVVAAVVVVVILRLSRRLRSPLGGGAGAGPGRRRRQPGRPGLPGAHRAVATSSTSSSCRAGRCSTWPTRRS